MYQPSQSFPNRPTNFVHCKLSAFSEVSEAAAHILNEVNQAKGGYAIAVNAEKFMAIRNNTELRAVIARSSFNYPDGVGAVMALRQKGVQSARIPGADLWLEVLISAEISAQNLRVAIVGARPETLYQACAILRKRYTHLDIVFCTNGYEGIHDEELLKDQLVHAQPQIVFLALGSPRQELLIERLSNHLPTTFFMGLGGSLDVLTGYASRAPNWMQKNGLEWLHRLLKNPSRLHRQWRLPVFLFLLKIRKI